MTTAASSSNLLDAPLDDLQDPKFYLGQSISPLRYPGSKRRLVPVIEALIHANVPKPELLLEPFCGGATTGLRLVATGAVKRLILADADPMVAAFWKTAAFDSAWLIAAMWEEDITLQRWDYWRSARPTDQRTLALQCLFLNRTTFSGILHGSAGPIGGREQTSQWKIDCRFNKQTTTRRIRAVADLASTGRLLDVWNTDYRDSIQKVRDLYPDLGAEQVAVYLDPPYVEKAPDLYAWSFADAEHSRLAETLLTSATPYRWILSYDDNPTVRALYSGTFGREVTRLLVEHAYSVATGKKRQVKDEVIVTTYPCIPSGFGCRDMDEPGSRRS